MKALLSGSTSGAQRIASGDNTFEDGPPAVSFFTEGAAETLALTPEGALWARAKEGKWRCVAARTVDDEPWSFAADPRLPDRLYIGVSPALLYRSDDGGLSWTACDAIKKIPGYETWTFPPPPHIPHIRSIAPDPEIPGGVYIGVEEGGVYRSPDGGETWESLNEGLYWDVHTVAPTSTGQNLYATTGAGFHRSSDGGHHWLHVTQGITHRYTVPLLVSKANPERLYTAAAAGPPPTWSQGVNCAIYRSDDAGESWQQLTRGLPDRFDILVRVLVEDEDGNLYASAGNTIFTSQDGGDNWSLFANDLPDIRSLVEA